MCSVERDVTFVLSRLPRYSKRRSRVLMFDGRISVRLPPARERSPVLTSLRLPWMTCTTSMRARTIDLPLQLTIRPRTTVRLPSREAYVVLWLRAKRILSRAHVLPRTPLASRLAAVLEPSRVEPPPPGICPVGSHTAPE